MKGLQMRLKSIQKPLKETRKNEKDAVNIDENHSKTKEDWAFWPGFRDVFGRF